MLNEADAVKRVVELMSLDGSCGHEREACEWIRRQLLAAGARPCHLAVDQAQRKSPHLDRGGDCGNLVLRLPGTFRSPRRMLCAHMDTVPLCEGSRPVRRGGRLVADDPAKALGADNRSGCAVILTAALEII